MIAPGTYFIVVSRLLGIRFVGRFLLFLKYFILEVTFYFYLVFLFSLFFNYFICFRPLVASTKEGFGSVANQTVRVGLLKLFSVQQLELCVLLETLIIFVLVALMVSNFYVRTFSWDFFSVFLLFYDLSQYLGELLFVLFHRGSDPLLFG